MGKYKNTFRYFEIVKKFEHLGVEVSSIKILKLAKSGCRIQKSIKIAKIMKHANPRANYLCILCLKRIVQNNTWNIMMPAISHLVCQMQL